MNYRHIFHAGNFADVFKHVLLSRALVYLSSKDRPFRYIDTHAGMGRYDLASSEAARGGEWQDGVGRLAQATASPECEALLEPYRRAADLVERGRTPRFYPGSPLIAQKLLRSADRMIFCEAHPKEAKTLMRAVGKDRRAKTIEIDGYTALRAYVPPVERRGLVLIDPPYEALDEAATILTNLQEAFAKWPTGCFLIWRPLKDLRGARAFDEALSRIAPKNVLRMDLTVREPSESGGLTGSGLLAVNPPWTLEAEARILLPALTEILGLDSGAGWSVRGWGRGLI